MFLLSYKRDLVESALFMDYPALFSGTFIAPSFRFCSWEVQRLWVGTWCTNMGWSFNNNNRGLEKEIGGAFLEDVL